MGCRLEAAVCVYMLRGDAACKLILMSTNAHISLSILNTVCYGCCTVNPLLTPTELGYFCIGFIFWLGALIHVSFYLCIDLSLFLILRVLSLVGQLAFTDMGACH